MGETVGESAGPRVAASVDFGEPRVAAAGEPAGPRVAAAAAPDGPRVLSLSIDRSLQGETVERALRQGLGASDACVRAAKAHERGILLDDVRVRVTERVAVGQVLQLLVDDVALGRPCSVAAQPGPVDVRYQDRDVLVVSKPAGLVVHPGPGHDDGTLANYVRGYLLGQGIDAGVHPVQRLDGGTSGLMIFALHSFAQDKLQGQLHTADFSRTYLALCDGWLEADRGTVDVPLARLTQRPSTFGVCWSDGSDGSPAGKWAVTHYRVLRRLRLPDGSAATLVELRLETGRTHQIRIHLAHIGHGLVGDEAYGVPSPLMARPALHSARIRFAHPVTGATVEVQEPLPVDMADLLQ